MRSNCVFFTFSIFWFLSIVAHQSWSLSCWLPTVPCSWPRRTCAWMSPLEKRLLGPGMRDCDDICPFSARYQAKCRLSNWHLLAGFQRTDGRPGTWRSRHFCPHDLDLAATNPLPCKTMQFCVKWSSIILLNSYMDALIIFNLPIIVSVQSWLVHGVRGFCRTTGQGSGLHLFLLTFAVEHLLTNGVLILISYFCPLRLFVFDWPLFNIILKG